MGIYAREPSTYNRNVTAKRLLLLHPKLTKKKADTKITELLRAGKLKPGTNGWKDVGEAWTIDAESLEEYEKKIYREHEEVRKRIVLKILEAIKQLTKEIRELKLELPQIIKKEMGLQAKKREEVEAKKVEF